MHDIDSEEEDIMMHRRSWQYEPVMIAQRMHMDEDYFSNENNDELVDEGVNELCIIDDPGLSISASCWHVNPLSAISFKCLMLGDGGGRVCSYLAASTSTIPRLSYHSRINFISYVDFNSEYNKKILCLFSRLTEH